MTSKKWVISLIAVSLVAVIAFGAVELYLDPLLQYGSDRGPLTSREYTEIYANPGIAKNYDYNAVFLGSSMVENANVSEIDELFGCKTIKVPYSGGSSYNHKTILDVCYNSGHKIDKVFWSLDEYALTTNKDTPRYPLPEYLYDDNILNDLSYLLNLDIFYFYTTKDIVGTLKHQNQPLMKGSTWIKDESGYCKENALASIDYPMEQADNKGEQYYQNRMWDNLNQNILPFIQNHPETEFQFYMVPYSILYWYQKKQSGTLDAELYIAKNAIVEILKYDNVKVHFFQDEESIITNLDLYKDFSHFKPIVNSWMSDEMKKESHLLAIGEIEERINNFKKFIVDYDYDTLIHDSI